MISELGIDHIHSHDALEDAQVEAQILRILMSRIHGIDIDNTSSVNDKWIEADDYLRQFCTKIIELKLKKSGEREVSKLYRAMKITNKQMKSSGLCKLMDLVDKSRWK